MGRMDDFDFNSISVIPGRLEGDNERQCAMEPRLLLKKIPPPTGLEPMTARSAGYQLYLLSYCVLTNTGETKECGIEWGGTRRGWGGGRVKEVHRALGAFNNILASQFINSTCGILNWYKK